MLQTLHIKDLAIIDELEVEFGPGLNIMTGETGAGKTIVVQSLGLVLGDRAAADVVRSGKERAVVTATFEVDGTCDELKRIMNDAGIDFAEGLVIQRIVAANGKGKISINGIPFSGNVLKSIAPYLVDMASQHEHQRLLDTTSHLSTVDEFGNLSALAAEYSEAHRRWSGIERELFELKRNEQAAKEKHDFLKFQFDELRAADLKPGEDEEIEARRKRLKHAVMLEERARMAEGLLYGNAGSAAEISDNAVRLIAQAAEVDLKAGEWVSRLGRAREEIESVARELTHYADSLESDPQGLEDLEERLHLVRQLMKKHGGSIEACLRRKDDIASELQKIDRYDDIVAEKNEELALAADCRRAVAVKLRAARRNAARELGSAVEAELCELAMSKTKFFAQFNERPENEWDESGPDACEFLFSPNPGEPMLSLARIASGGELSRVMLSLKGALAGKSGSSATSIFDEVDSGIGGAVAEVVGRKLKSVARSRQVICITHLPQVAAYGDCHLRISKKLSNGRTIAGIEMLSGEARKNEIARMLGGEKITGATLAHAEEMLEWSFNRQSTAQSESSKHRASTRSKSQG